MSLSLACAVKSGTAIRGNRLFIHRRQLMAQPFSQVRRTMIAITMGGTALAVTAQGHAQENASFDRTTITTGFAPGGSSDTVARLLAEYLTGRYADTVVV